MVQAIYALSSGTSRSAAYRLSDPVPNRFFGSLKRLLEADLAQSRRVSSSAARRELAFHGAPPKGRGFDVDYTPEKAFNLAVARELINFGFKPSEAITLIYEIMPALEHAFDRATQSRTTFGRSSETKGDRGGSEQSLRDKLNALKIFLVVRRVEITRQIVAELDEQAVVGGYIYGAEICNDRDSVAQYLASELRDGLFGAFVIELSEIAQRIVELLRDEPRRERGRKRQD